MYSQDSEQTRKTMESIIAPVFHRIYILQRMPRISSANAYHSERAKDATVDYL